MPNKVNYPNGETTETRYYCPSGCGFWSSRAAETDTHEKTHYNEPVGHCVYCKKSLSITNYSGICRACKKAWKNRGVCFRCGRTYYLGADKHPKYSFCDKCRKEMRYDFRCYDKFDEYKYKDIGRHHRDTPVSELTIQPIFGTTVVGQGEVR